MNLKAIAAQAALLLVVGTLHLSHAQAAGNDDGLVEGRDYILISPAQPTSSPSDKVEVAEVFMYSCPHCFEFEPHWQAWQKQKADYINVVRLPTSWNTLAKLHAQAYYTEQVLGKLGQMDEDFFNEFHVKHRYLDTPEKLQEFFGRYGVSADAFNKAFNSFAVHTKVQRAE
jgi:thiol:disulfide interchange protein DsbA